MPDLLDGESVKVQGSGSKPYELKNVGGVYSCTCPAWRNQSVAIESRTCKHLRALRGHAAEQERVGLALPAPAQAAKPGAEAAPVLLAEPWDGAADVSGWWMSEKLDGVRAYWNGSAFISRLGNPFHVPDWFLEGLPSEPLDGELWLARKSFQRTSGIVRRQDRSDHWKEIRYVVFDAPALDAGFEQRMEFVRSIVRDQPSASVHPHERCEGIDHLRQELARVESLGGECLMLRQPGSRYVAGRSATLLKVKSFRDDEARVICHQAGAGRHRGRLGALLVEMASGVQFSVGTGFSDSQRENPPPIGSIITFRYQELSDGGVPRFPSFGGVRQEEPLADPATTELPSPAPCWTESTLSRPAAEASSLNPPAPAPGKEATLSPVVAGASRRLELVDGASSKFWEIAVAGSSVTVRYGRIGSDGQSNAKNFPTESAAQQHAQKLIQEKSSKGYSETVR